MAQITIRGLDQDLLNRLKRRASANKRSLEGEARVILQGAAAEVVDEEDRKARRAKFIERVKFLHSLTDASKLTPSEELIREDRDSDHGNDS